MSILLFILTGLGVGFAIGATGVGGGALMTPALIMGFGISPAIAVGTDLLFAAITKSFGVFLHRKVGTVKWKIVGLLALGSMPTSAVTVYVLAHVGINAQVEMVMKITLGLAVGLTALGVLLRKPLEKAIAHQRFAGLKTLHQQYHVPLTVVSGVLLGGIVTLSSVGAGVIGAMILLLLYPRLKTIEVIGTDLAHAVPLTLLAGVGHMHLGTTDFSLLGWLLIGSLPGIWLGTRVGLRLSDEQLRPILAGLLLLIGLSLVIRSF